MKLAAASPAQWGFILTDSEAVPAESFGAAFAAFVDGDFDRAEALLQSLIGSRDANDIRSPKLWELRQLRIANLLASERLADAEAESACLLRETETDGDSRSYAVALSSGSAVAALQGHFHYAIELGARAKRLLVGMPYPTDLSRALTNLGYSLLMAGDLDRGRRELAAAASLAEAVGSDFLLARAYQQLGLLDEKLGDFGSARSHFAQALDAYERAGAIRHKFYAHFALASMSCLLGDLDSAKPHIAAIQAQFDEQPATVRRDGWYLLSAWISVRRGEYEEGIHSLKRLVTTFEVEGSQRKIALCHEFLGDAYLALHEFGPAEMHLSAGLEIARRVSAFSDAALECLWKLGEVYLATGRLAEALQCSRQGLRITRATGNRFERAAVYRLRGKIQVARGRMRLAESLLQHAWHEYSSMGAEVDAHETWKVLAALRGGEAAIEGIVVPKPRPPRITVGPSRSTVRALEAEIRAAGIISEDARVLEAYQHAVRAADTRLPVLILGETGTGKELFATLIHKRSATSKSFVPVNCAALPPDLLDAELFGHSRGAFTGALRDRPGLIEEANEGTLFLDEVGEMTLPVQGRLLRALEQGEIRRLGETKPRFVTTRYVAATHRNLEEMVRQGSFRTDLYFRLKGVVIQIPPLRERKRDIELLTDQFLHDCSIRLHRSVRLTPDARAQMLDHSWPGNVRELKSLIDRLIAMSDDGTEIDSLRLGLGSVRTGASLAEHLEEEERSRVRGVLQSVRWNQSAAARALKIKRTTLIGKMRRLGIEPPRKF